MSRGLCITVSVHYCRLKSQLTERTPEHTMRMPPFATYQNQILAAATANICTLGLGCMLGWMSPYLVLLMSTDTPLDAPLTPAQSGWIASTLSLAAIFSNVATVGLLRVLSTKGVVLISALPLIASWVCVYAATNAWYLLAARALAGLTLGSAFIAVPLFVTDMADDRVRGQLNSFLTVFFNAGMLFAFVIGKQVGFYVFPLVIMVFPVVFLIGFMCLPDTPQSLLRRRNYDAAEQSLRFYRNCYDPLDTNAEARLKEELTRLQQIYEMSNIAAPVTVSEFYSVAALRAFATSIVMMGVGQFSGSLVMISYAALVFQRMDSVVEAGTATIILGSMQVVGTFMSSQFVDRCGRKTLLLVSTALSAFCLFTLATYSLLHESYGWDVSAFSWLPVVVLSLFIFASAIGMTPVPYVTLVEMLPQRIRQMGVAIGVAAVSVYAFTALQSFPHLLLAVGLSNCFYAFAVISGLGFVFTVGFIVETKGINVHRI